MCSKPPRFAQLANENSRERWKHRTRIDKTPAFPHVKTGFHHDADVTHRLDHPDGMEHIPSEPDLPDRSTYLEALVARWNVPNPDLTKLPLALRVGWFTRSSPATATWPPPSDIEGGSLIEAGTQLVLVLLRLQLKETVVPAAVKICATEYRAPTARRLAPGNPRRRLPHVHVSLPRPNSDKKTLGSKWDAFVTPPSPKFQDIRKPD